MASSFVDQFFDLLFSPIGLIGVMTGLIVAIQAQRSRLLCWGLFTLCCFSASLGKLRDQFISEPPALTFPLQQIRDAGRPLTIVFLVLLLLLSFTKVDSWRRQLFSYPIQYLAGVQLIVFLKTIFYGDLVFALVAAVTFASVLIMIRFGPSRWLSDDKNFRYAAFSMVMVAIIFIVLNAYQAAVDIYPITFFHGRFLGTTGNPQHAAVLLASILPCLMFVLEDQDQKWRQCCVLICIACVCLALLMTGSRTGMLMTIATLLFFYRNQKKSFFQMAIALCVVLAVALPMILKDGALLGADQTSAFSRFSSTENTREEVWSALWRTFNQYPILGAPLRGERIVYGESSWLATAANLGLVGLVPLCLFGTACVKMMIRLFDISKQQPVYYLQCSTVISGIACLLVGSFFEPFLLGNVSSTLLTMLLYLSLGQYILERRKMQEHIKMRQQFLMESLLV